LKWRLRGAAAVLFIQLKHLQNPFFIVAAVCDRRAFAGKFVVLRRSQSAATVVLQRSQFIFQMERTFLPESDHQVQ
jgi:hypothetical protein